MQRQQGYIPTLDGWRAVAIGCVLASHLLGNVAAEETGVVALGQFGVNLFFGLSGFLITGRLIAERTATGHISLSDFYLRRGFRILPAALAALACLGVGAALHILPVSGLELTGSALFFRNYLPPNLPLGTGWYTSHFWSLSLEEHFYALWPPLLARCWRGPRAGGASPARAQAALTTTTTASLDRLARLALGLAIAVAIWRLVEGAREVSAYGHILGPHTQRTDFRLDALLCGAAVAAAFANPVVRTWWTSRRGALAWSVAAAAFVGLIIWRGVGPSLWQSVLIPVLIAGTAARPSDIIGRVLELAPLRWIGRISYSLYLWQQLWTPVVGLPRPLGVLQQWPVNMVAVFASAALSYYVIERPLIRLGSRWRTGRGAATLRHGLATADFSRV